MSRPFRRAAAGLCLASGMTLALAATAWAEAPFVTPQHDVDVLYAVPMPDGTSGGQRMRWSSSGLAQRVDLDGSATFMLTDYRTHVLQVVDTLHRTYSRMPAPGGALTPPGEPAPGEFHAESDDTVAGEPCRWWRSGDNEGHEARFCYTPDGVLLAARRGDMVVARAVRLSRAAQAADVFAVPSGYRGVAPHDAPAP
ncbi:hypothetical protein AA103196_0317 [Ameyamaea chiangmaiensis NBRC 103196]|uniref:hypothetical protein n=1 Tax=Ameyamaea chiangmaiensis TaxID=442969 RepID=UPI001BAEFE3C|nr:hypothetical protein [Ameyamaea chiangmaiensis]MBS4074714.1 hypothetical protein [Ameyamaea chiangmaiensis]GBQ62463.1 hypothetical protein AA103196_0317 [Ameyamaea chiangmaiensis NBRC 103196]